MNNENIALFANENSNFYAFLNLLIKFHSQIFTPPKKNSNSFLINLNMNFGNFPIFPLENIAEWKLEFNLHISITKKKERVFCSL